MIDIVIKYWSGSREYKATSRTLTCNLNSKDRIYLSGECAGHKTIHMSITDDTLLEIVKQRGLLDKLEVKV